MDGARLGALAGALAAAAAASACCVGPLVLALLGVGGAGALVALEPYRLPLTILTLAALGVGWFLTLRRPPAPAGAACDCPQPRARRTGRWLLGAVSLLVLGLLAFPSLAPRLPLGGPAVPAGAAAVQTATLAIEGMTCASCAVTVRAAVRDLPGVQGITVDPEAGRAILSFEPALVSPARVAAAISAAGYPAHPVSPPEG